MSHVFPQLETGAYTQYPFHKTSMRRTIASMGDDGTLLRLSDHAFKEFRWTLLLSSISDSEAAAITGLFRAMQGSVGEFTFLDPSSNLLRWSENLGEAAWVRDPQLSVEIQQAPSPAGERTAMLTSAAQTLQSIRQTIPAPGGFRYAFTFYARADESVLMEAGAFQSEAGGMKPVRVHTAWRRIHVELPASDSGLQEFDIGIRMPAGSRCHVCALQLEAQPTPSQYRPSFARSGIHSRARFASDELRMVAQGPGRHDVRLEIRARE